MKPGEKNIQYNKANNTQLRGCSHHPLSAPTTLSALPPPSQLCVIYIMVNTVKNWPPRYNWNIVESGVKNHNPNRINIDTQNLLGQSHIIFYQNIYEKHPFLIHFKLTDVILLLNNDTFLPIYTIISRL